MKKNYVIILIVGLIIFGGIIFYIWISNDKLEATTESNFWYSNNLYDDSKFAMRVIGTSCSNRYVYFYKNKVIVTDWEDMEQEPVVLDIIYYKNKPNLEEYINYAMEETISLSLYDDNNDDILNTTYYGLYQILKQGNTLYLEMDDIKTKDLLSTISEKNLFDCYG